MVVLETLAGIAFTLGFLWYAWFTIFVLKDLRALAGGVMVLFAALFASAFWLNAAGFSGANLHPRPPPISTEAPQ